MLIVVLALVVQVAAPVNVTGEYKSSWDDVKLVQDGDRVFGTYVCCGGGTIKGRIIDGRIKFEWDEPRGAGHGAGIWTIRGDTLEATWGHEQSADNGGPWNLTRKGKTYQIAN